MIEYKKNIRTGLIDKTVVVYDNQLEFHLDSNGLSIYGISKIDDDYISTIRKGWGKMTLKIYKDEILNFIKDEY